MVSPRLARASVGHGTAATAVQCQLKWCPRGQWQCHGSASGCGVNVVSTEWNKGGWSLASRTQSGEIRVRDGEVDDSTSAVDGDQRQQEKQDDRELHSSVVH
jgi:hypothetical protein